MTLLNLDNKLLFNILYNSHTLEPFTKCEAPNFLKKTGIIRFIAPAIDGSTEKPDSLFLEVIK